MQRDHRAQWQLQSRTECNARAVCCSVAHIWATPMDDPQHRHWSRTACTGSASAKAVLLLAHWCKKPLLRMLAKWPLRFSSGRLRHS